MKKREMTDRNISVVNFENNKVPEMKEVKGRDWIGYGEKNDYPDYLIKLFDRSAKHNAIVTGKVHYIKGGGFIVDSKQMDTATFAKYDNWLKNISPKDSLDSMLSKVITDIELFDGCYLEVIPNKLKNGIAEINHIGFEKIRVNKSKDGYIYSNDWSCHRQTQKDTGLTEMKPFDKSTFSGLFRYKKYRPGPRVYPIPEYVGCISYIEIDYEIANFHLNNIKNGFVGGTMISFNNGTPTPEAAHIIEQKIKNKFTGTDKAGQLVITFSDNKDSAPTIIPLLPNGFDKMFDTLNQTVQQEIFTGHKITSLGLFGIKEANGLGSKDELREAFELLQSGYITPKQNIVSGIFNDFSEINGYGRPLSIQQVKPITDSLSQADIVKVMTPDEIRAEAGLPPLNTGVKMSQCFHHAINNFKSAGKSKGDFKIIKSTQVNDKQDVLLNEIRFYKEKFFDQELVNSKILNLINSNPNLSIEDISKAAGEPIDIIKKEISIMIDKQLLKGSIGKLEILPEGKAIIETTPEEPSKVEILYSYEERTGLPPLLTESRAFCQELMDLNKLYTRQEIDQISQLEDRDVWETRGGFFHNTKLNQTTPYCRHVWTQNVVRRK